MPIVKRVKRKKIRPGRPSTYTSQLADEICEWLAMGNPLTTYCKQPGKPNYSTVMHWIWRESEFKEDFSIRYARAREQQAEYMSDQIIEIADDSSGDMVIKTDKKGRQFEALDHENVNRSRLRIDSRKWIASKLRPKKFGDASSVKLSDEDGGPLIFKVIYENKPEMADEEE